MIAGRAFVRVTGGGGGSIAAFVLHIVLAAQAALSVGFAAIHLVRNYRVLGDVINCRRHSVRQGQPGQLRPHRDGLLRHAAGKFLKGRDTSVLRHIVLRHRYRRKLRHNQGGG